MRRPSRILRHTICRWRRAAWCVVRGGVEIRRHLVGIQLADGLGDACGEIFGAAAIGRHAAEQVWGDGDVTRGGEFVGKFLRPVAEAEDFVNDEDHGTLVLRFGVNDQRVHVSAIVFYGDPLAVARRFVDAFARPRL